MATLVDRLRHDGTLDPDVLLPAEDLAYLVNAANRIDALESALSAIAHCDTPGHPSEEPHGLYRSMMILIAKNALTKSN